MTIVVKLGELGQLKKKTVQKDLGPYLNNVSTWSEAHVGVSESTFASLKMEKKFCAPGAWSKRVTPILLMSHGCFFA